MISIATWNVNSVKARLPHLLAWLQREKPDVVLLQELKCVDEAFPLLEIEELGYHVAVYGEKTYNGVAILSKYRLEDVTRGLSGDSSDTQSRYIEAVVSVGQAAWRVASVYVPNGQDAESDKFQYKLRFLDRLQRHLKHLLSYDEPVVIGGDYNIAPHDIDVHNPRRWAGSVLTHDAVRRLWRAMEYLGYYNAYRICHPEEKAYSWWDYRENAFGKDEGLLIDHLLLSPQAADQLEKVDILKNMRGEERASDHAPMVGEFRTTNP